MESIERIKEEFNFLQAQYHKWVHKYVDLRSEFAAQWKRITPYRTEPRKAAASIEHSFQSEREAEGVFAAPLALPLFLSAWFSEWQLGFPAVSLTVLCIGCRRGNRWKRGGRAAAAGRYYVQTPNSAADFQSGEVRLRVMNLCRLPRRMPEGLLIEFSWTVPSLFTT